MITSKFYFYLSDRIDYLNMMGKSVGHYLYWMVADGHCSNLLMFVVIHLLFSIREGSDGVCTLYQVFELLGEYMFQAKRVLDCRSSNEKLMVFLRPSKLWPSFFINGMWLLLIDSEGCKEMSVKLELS